MEHKNKELRLEALKNVKLIFLVIGINPMENWIIKLKKEIAMGIEIKRDCPPLYDYYKAYYNLWFIE